MRCVTQSPDGRCRDPNALLGRQQGESRLLAPFYNGYNIIKVTQCYGYARDGDVLGHQLFPLKEIPAGLFGSLHQISHVRCTLRKRIYYSPTCPQRTINNELQISYKQNSNSYIDEYAEEPITAASRCRIPVRSPSPSTLGRRSVTGEDGDEEDPDGFRLCMTVPTAPGPTSSTVSFNTAIRVHLLYRVYCRECRQTYVRETDRVQCRPCPCLPFHCFPPTCCRYKSSRRRQ